VALAAPALSADVLEQGFFQVEHAANDADLARRSADILEAFQKEWAHVLPLGSKPIRVVIAPSLAVFRQHSGPFSSTEISGIAYSHRGLIVVKAPHLRRLGGNYAGTLRHELGHVLLHRNTNTNNLPRWLNEGTVMMMAKEYEWASPYRVAKMYLQRRLIAYPLLDEQLAVPGNEIKFGDAYAQSYSMTRYLHKTLGKDLFWAVVLGCEERSFFEALQQEGGTDPQEFWPSYLRALWLATLVSVAASGSFFGPPALLVLVAYYRKHRSNKVILARWAEEKADLEDSLFHWEDVTEDPEAWKGDQ
jgi:hypothetical protein